MKLEQKFAEILTFTEIEGCYQLCLDCVKISDNHALGFGKWIIRNYNNYGQKTELELLKIFNQETDL